MCFLNEIVLQVSFDCLCKYWLRKILFNSNSIRDSFNPKCIIYGNYMSHLALFDIFQTYTLYKLRNGEDARIDCFEKRLENCDLALNTKETAVTYQPIPRTHSTMKGQDQQADGSLSYLGSNPYQELTAQ